MFFFTDSYNKTAEMRVGEGKVLQARAEKKKIIECGGEYV